MSDAITFSTPYYRSQFYVIQQHVMRYVFAGEFVQGESILDLACGSGYGSSYLTRKGDTEVIGIDLSAQAIKYARDHYKDAKLRFLQGDATCIPLRDDSLDMVISFETIEHLKKYQEFLNEIVRVLKIDGTFICSTPNVKHTFHPRYHVKEFKPDEFFDLLRNFFVEVYPFAQYVNVKDRISEVRNYHFNRAMSPIEHRFFLLVKKLNVLNSNGGRALKKIYRCMFAKSTCKRDKTYEITENEEILYNSQRVVRIGAHRLKLLRIMIAVCKSPMREREHVDDKGLCGK